MNFKINRMKRTKKITIRLIVAVVLAGLILGILLNLGTQYDPGILAPYYRKVSADIISQGELKLDGQEMELAATGNLTMKMNTEDYSVQIMDKANGYVWDTASTEEYHGVKIRNKLLRRGLRQLFQMNIVNKNNESEIVNNIVAENTVKAMKIKDGVQLVYYFTDYKIGVSLNLFLEGNTFHVMIPVSSIIEEGDYRIASLDVLPMFGASRPDEDGYFVYPDGCGALYRFGEEKESKPSPFIRDVYSQSTYELDLLKEESTNEIKNISIPAFGIVRGSNAILGYITEGDTSSTLRIAPAGNTYQLERIYPSAVYRKTYRMVMPDGKESMEVETDKRAKNYHVQYRFVYQPKGASYADLAKEARSILQEIKQLPVKKAKVIQDQLSIQFLMGSIEKTLLYDSYKTMTTYGQAADILKDLKNNTKIDFSTILFGWQKTGFGIAPSQNSPASEIGGKSGETQFFSEINSMGIDGYENMEPIYAQSDSPGYSKRTDLAENAVGIAITDKNQTQFLLRPLKVLADFTGKWSGRFQRNNVKGIALDTVGTMIYDDYNKDFTMTREDTATAWITLAELSRKSAGKTAVQGGNAYMFSATDYLYDIPDQNSNYTLYSESIPFYQMIIHGYLPYTSSTAGNLAYDYEYQKLKWIEYGSIPSFILTKAKTDRLKNTEANQLFTSEYSLYRQKIIDLAKEYQTNLQGILGAELVNHKRTGDLVKVTYGNGVSILINYGDKPIVAEGIQINPKEYKVKEETGYEAK